MAHGLFTSMITNDCKNIVVHPPTLITEGASATIKITNGSFSSTELQVSSLVTTLTIATSDIGTDKGVFHIKYYENGVLQRDGGVVATCDILCCLSKKVDKLLDCSADCSKCASELAEAQQIFLLLKSAQTELSGSSVTAAKIANATSKYSKAAEICGGHCGCNC